MKTKDLTVKLEEPYLISIDFKNKFFLNDLGPYVVEDKMTILISNGSVLLKSITEGG